ncbi:MAG: ATP-binding cassette domain-containing protein [Lachnospiraceae bacterium]|nr:ATP-binding cassette domain-containing protein [Lachnospiraceae bacterium]
MLQIQDVTKNYQNFVALEHINLEFENGIYGLLAPNGAGKTTLLKLITTLLFPTEGKILYDGVEVRKLDALYREMLGFLPQDFGYYREYTPEKYLHYIGVLKGMERKELQDKIGQMLELVGLSEQKNKKMKKFSGGMIQRVGIAQALLNDPQILVLDEPTAGLDPGERMRFRKILTSLSKDKTVLVSTHIVSDVEFIANHIVMLKDKKVHCNDTVENICKKLEGSIFETAVGEEELSGWEERYQVVSRRREGRDIVIRFISRNGGQGWQPVKPGLEDVFLFLYGKE